MDLVSNLLGSAPPAACAPPASPSPSPEPDKLSVLELTVAQHTDDIATHTDDIAAIVNSKPAVIPAAVPAAVTAAVTDVAFSSLM